MENPQKKHGVFPMLRRNFLFFMIVGMATVSKDFVINGFQFFCPKAISLLNRRLNRRQLLSEPQADIETVTPGISPPKTGLTDAPVIAADPPKAIATMTTLNKKQPIALEHKTLKDISFYQVTIDLNDPENLLTIGLANNATQANNSRSTKGDEPFATMVARSRAAVVVNGTFFSIDAQKQVMGNMVAGGKFLKYRPWENYGTTLGVKAGNQLEMKTARIEGRPQWQEHWFSITSGPRLLKDGKIWLAPKSEGFRDPSVLNIAYRTAIGFSTQKKLLFLVAFLVPLSLQEEATMMQEIGCDQAMNLDGGSSEALAYHGNILIAPESLLTNVIVAYDRKFPAPKALKTSWEQFQRGDQSEIPKF
ncbi:phosphodiester glycosidase family protein [Planktothricoides raciborskii]|uniref:Phosphodiester glycosidase family protein n=2 Tax=Planktothricoides raciborskii TaxID=132608 RepID=A0AAU8JKW4_9CYAN|nr:phosphodiester glycosidase family protein [Planktothricoides raciborskii]